MNRRSRVQGSWNNSNLNRLDSTQQKDQLKSACSHKVPEWTGKNVDISGSACHLPPRLTFHQPTDEALRSCTKTKTTVITNPGVFDLSITENGLSRVRLFHDFISQFESDRLFSVLMDQIPWEQKYDCKDGVRYPQPRLVAWYGDSDYSYSGLSHSRRAQFLPELRDVNDLLERMSGETFNSVLCNLYQNNKDHVSWHADDESLFGSNPTIASVSLGDIRNFELLSNQEIDGQRSLYKLPLPHGSLLIMEGACQKDWKHRVPIEYHDRAARINLTYRLITQPQKS